MIREQVEGSPGFATGLKFQPDELTRVRQLIEQQWLERIGQVVPSQTEAFAERGMSRYHELSSLVDHGSLWSRDARMLSQSTLRELRQMSLFKQLESEFGSVMISDEFNKGWEAVYLRFVRPHQLTDIGPIHADQWFWDIGQWPVPENTHRVKVWIPIHCESGLNGLCLVPDSHQKSWPYIKEEKQGVIKPKIQVDEAELSPQLIPTQSGEAIIFNDKLLHGGAVNRGKFTRISIEFTMFVSSEVTQQRHLMARI